MKYIPGAKEMSPLVVGINSAISVWIGFFVPVHLSRVVWEKYLCRFHDNCPGNLYWVLESLQIINSSRKKYFQFHYQFSIASPTEFNCKSCSNSQPLAGNFVK
jgi:hypothetical protein